MEYEAPVVEAVGLTTDLTLEDGSKRREIEA